MYAIQCTDSTQIMMEGIKRSGATIAIAGEEFEILATKQYAMKYICNQSYSFPARTLIYLSGTNFTSTFISILFTQ